MSRGSPKQNYPQPYVSNVAVLDTLESTARKGCVAINAENTSIQAVIASIRLKCIINCIKMQYKAEESQHPARDINCPVYQRRLKNYRGQINYSDNFL